MANEQILIVEDQRAVAGALKLRLRGLGYDVPAIARDGREAIEKAAEIKPDLILMDVQLGDGMDGIETARRIRAEQDIPVVYISSHVDTRLLERARPTRPAGFINKPFTTKDLLTAIDMALHRREAASAAAVAPEPPVPEELPKDGVITADHDGRVGFINAEAEYITGLARRQLGARPVAEVLASLYGLHAAAAAELVLRVLNGHEERIQRPRGGRFGGVEPCSDLLTSLRDSRGQIYGLALRLTAQRPARSARGHLDRALCLALDALSHGVIVVGEEGRVEHTNRSARDILGRNRGIEIRNDQLSLGDKALDQRFHELLDTALRRAKAGHDHASGAMFVRAPMAGEHTEILVVPVASHGGADLPQALVYLFDSGSQRQVSFDILTGLYGLTHTEAKLVQFMTNGMTLDEAGEELQISVNTARTHLKHIFHKTGINRQTELIHRIESGPAALIVNFDSRPE